MKATFKTITFDHDFVYSKGGEFVTAREITVCEPNYDRRHVYRTMRAYLAKADLAMMKFYADMTAGQKTSDPDDVPLEPKMDDAPKKAAVEPDVLDQMRMALGLEGFPTFCDYVQKELTGCKQLAFVGTDMAGEIRDRSPITEEVWMAISKAGGMEAIDKVLSAFASFFSGYQPETAKTTG